MKIATVLSVSALLAMFSVVACSSPTTPASDKSDSADSTKDDDSDSTPAKKTSSTNNTSTTNNNTPAATTTTTGTTTDTQSAAEQKCDTCMASKDPKVAALFTCLDAAKSDSDAEACEKTAGCDSEDPNNACGKAAAACQTECQDAANEADQQMDQQEAACKACVASNTQATAIETCFGNAQSQADADKCDKMQCDSSCESAYDKCDKECSF